MDSDKLAAGQGNLGRPSQPANSMMIDWFAEGEPKTVDCGGVRMTVRFVGRMGRRGRIAIEAPAGAVFQGVRRPAKKPS